MKKIELSMGDMSNMSNSMSCLENKRNNGLRISFHVFLVSFSFSFDLHSVTNITP